MRILILGGDGMLGHRLYLQLKERHDAAVTLRRPFDAYASLGLFDAGHAYTDVDAQRYDSVERALNAHSPDVVLNAVGIVKQLDAAHHAVPSIEVNSLLPHRLAASCERLGSRLIHFSTDCVFSGRRGGYSEDDTPDATDLYGRSKLLGEVSGRNALTLRTSMIGRELARKVSLLEWFLAQKGPVKGFRRAIFSGFTTAELARITQMLIEEHPEASGLHHVSSEPINKYDLLCLVRDRFGLSTEITPDDDFHCDRSLDSSRFRQAYGYQPPTWQAMIDELAAETH